MDAVVEVVGRADHGEDLTCLRVHGDEVAVIGAQAPELLLTGGDRMLRGLLQRQVESGRDRKAALVDDTGAVGLLQLLEDVVHEMRRLAAAVFFEDEIELG
jgi:hypothetical protein